MLRKAALGWVVPVLTLAAPSVVHAGPAAEDAGPPSLPEPADGSATPADEPTSDPAADAGVDTSASADTTTTSADLSTDAAVEPAPVGAADTEAAPFDKKSDTEKDPDSPVVRAENGDWAFSFIFGGLAPMSITGINNFSFSRLFFSELGFRRKFDRITIPFSVGVGVFHHNPDDEPMDGIPDHQNDVGLAGTVGLQYDFRQWRRIVPHVGGLFHIHYLDPTGDDNWLVNLGIGPFLGIEYYIGDRVSLLLQGTALVGVNIFDTLTQVSFLTTIAYGGQMGLNFYF